MRALRKRWYWLAPGIGVKRWGALFGLGVLAACAGGLGWLLPHWPGLGVGLSGARGAGALAAGSALAAVAAGRGLLALKRVWLGGGREDPAAYLRQYRHAERGPRVVVIGGGTGLATLLRGLKKYTSNLTAIVTVSDDGGSSGRLREDLGMLPPGDIRNCLLALADTEPVMERLFQHRFRQGRELAGHNFGNLFIAAMTEMSGDFEQAVRLFSQVLAVRGRVLPSTLSDVRLRAVFADGGSLVGETAILRSGRTIARVELEPPAPAPLPEALEAIAAAEVVVLGPGSLYTSVIPNLLVSGVVPALRSSPAPKVLVSNIMTQPGETDGYRAVDHVRAVLDVTGPSVIDLVLLNDEPVPPDRLAGYTEQGAEPVLANVDEVRALGLRVECAPLLSRSGLVRHDPDRLARAVLLAAAGTPGRRAAGSLGVRSL